MIRNCTRRSPNTHELKQTLYYVHDPMCSWCWAFRPTWSVVQAELPINLPVVRVLGGLATDTEEPMPMHMKAHLQNTWRQIQRRVPGTLFNFAFWEQCKPKRSTYPACRAMIAAREQGPGNEDAMTLAIQQAYYLHARNPSERPTLVDLAGDIGLDQDRFSRCLDTPEIAALLEEEIEFTHQIGARAFPSLILANGDSHRSIVIDYNQPQAILKIISQLLDE